MILTGIRFKVFITLMLALAVAGCSRDDVPDTPYPSTSTKTMKVAVVAPIGDAATKTRMERTAGWFAANFIEAQQGDSIQVRLEPEWYDELSTDLETLSKELAGREDIIAIIGPFSNENMALFAPACQIRHKPLIAPTVTSEDVLRRFAVSNAGNKETVNKDWFFWPLCQSDVAFTETLFSQYVTRADKETPLSCSFVTPYDKYGETFYNWAPFHANNLKVSLENNLRYNTTDELVSSLTQIETAGFCIVETSRQLYEAASITDTANTYFVFSSISEEGLATLGTQSADALQGVSGFSPYADCATGFEQAYAQRFGVKPTFAECKLYDALLLTGIAAHMYEHTHLYYTTGSEYDMTMNEWINTMIMVAGTDHPDREPMQTRPVWHSAGLREYMQLINGFMYEPFCGASGYIIFDQETCMQTAPATYVNWQIDNGNILHKNYYGSETSWQYNEAEALEDFADMAQDKDVQIQYAALTDQYAVLVQGSNGMNNYRHQADVLSMYQMLRLNGFDDDHIILIIDGDLADNPDNNESGIIRNSLTGNDLLGGTDAQENEKWREWIGNPQATGLYNPEYPSAIPDYDTDTLTARDIALILTGKRSSHLPTVLPQDQGNNVLLYWSGHGRNVNHGGTDELVWRETQAGNGMTATLLRETMEQMRYRKVFTIVEPCYSEGVILPLHGLTGVLAMSGASGDEQSWAENWNHGLGRYGTWMYDRFTKNVVDFLMEKPTAPFRDFYLYCMQNTIGSHVKLVNADFFGNLYTQNPEEFIKYKQ